MIVRSLKYKGSWLRIIAECKPKPYSDIPLCRHFYSGNKLYYKSQRDGTEIGIDMLTQNEVIFDSATQVYLVKGVFRP